MTTTPHRADRQTGHGYVAIRDEQIVHFVLTETRRTGAQRVIRQLARLSRGLPEAVTVVVVSVPTVEALTVELLTGIAISRRAIAASGRRLVLSVPGEPTTSGAAALIRTMPFVFTSEPNHEMRTQELVS